MKSRFPVKNPGPGGRRPDTPMAANVKPASKERALAEGVPLPKLIKRELEERAEIVMVSQPRSVFAERFRRLKTKLQHREGGAPQVIVVTSGVPSEGKTTVAINLALAFAAERDDRTLLIDADLRRPSIGRLLQPVPHLGFSEILAGRADPAHGILRLKSSSLEILPAGEPSEDPLQLISSANARSVIADLRKQYSRVIIDTPPILPFTDADGLGALSDGVLIVTRAGVTPVAVYQQVVVSVTAAPILGVVLNETVRSASDAGRYYNKYYDEYYAKDRK